MEMENLKKNIQDSDSLTKFLYEVGTLRKISRAQRQILFTHDDTDNIASHSHRVVIIGYFLALEEKANVEKVMIMCTFHDVEETRTGDRNWAHKAYVKTLSDKIIADQIKPLPNGTNLAELLSEYAKRESPESIIAKDADLIDQVLLLREYERAGNKEATDWLKDKSHDSYVKTKSAKKLHQAILSANPGEWWYTTGTSMNL